MGQMGQIKSCWIRLSSTMSQQIWLLTEMLVLFVSMFLLSGHPQPHQNCREDGMFTYIYIFNINDVVPALSVNIRGTYQFIPVIGAAGWAIWSDVPGSSERWTAKHSEQGRGHQGDKDKGRKKKQHKLCGKNMQVLDMLLSHELQT